LKDNNTVLDSGGSTSIYENASLGTADPHMSDDSVSIGGAVDGGGAIETSSKIETPFGFGTTSRTAWQISCYTLKRRIRRIHIIRGPTKAYFECR